ncbi:SusC/RagA family TonB-linked outer membrane protein, partial [Dawidia soli]
GAERGIRDRSYYRNRSSRQLTGRRLPELTGFATVQDNAPVTVQNSGLEVLLSATLIDGEHLSWTTSANVTIPRTKLVRYDGLAQSPNNVRYMIGSPLDIRLLYRYTGIDPQTGRFTFDDGNNDELDFTDRYPVAYGPELYGGIDNVIRYRNFELSLLFQFVKQIRQDVIAFFPTPGVRNHNQPVEVMQRWQKPGDVVPIHRFTQSPGGVVEYVSGINVGDMTYRNASYIRLKSAALFYTIASPVLQEKMNIKTLRVFVQGQNLVTFTRYRGFDPESLIPEFLPPLRVLTAGVEIKL